MPGPLFTFAAYLGAALDRAPNGRLGGAVCRVAIYPPSFLLLIGVLPLWDTLRGRSDVQSALQGVNAVVVGLLLAALYTAVWTSGITSPVDSPSASRPSCSSSSGACRPGSSLRWERPRHGPRRLGA